MAAGYDPIFNSAGQQYGIDPDLLRAMAGVESNDDPNAVGDVPAIGDPNDRAMGIMQIRGSTAKAAGIDPMDPTQAIPYAASLLSQGYKQFGNPVSAVMSYHGGTNQKNWGPKTQAYAQKVAAAYQQQGQQMPGMPPTAPTGNGAVNPFAAFDGSAQQQQDMPGLPPTGPTPSARAIDPFAGLDDSTPPAAPSGAPKSADPFAGLDDYAAKQGKTAAQPAAAAGAPNDLTAGQHFMLGNDPLYLAGRAMAHHVGSALNGVAQGIEHGVTSAVNYAAPNSDAADYLNRSTAATDAYLAQREKDYQASQPNGAATAVGAGAGDVAPWLIGGPGRLMASGGRMLGDAYARVLPPLLQGAGRVAGRLEGAAGAGAASSAAQPVTQPGDFGQQKAQQAESGAITGGAVGGLAGAAGRLFSPWASQDAQTLMANGITPTFGQLGRPFFNALEQKATSIPLLGDAVRAARQRAVTQLNTTIANQALAPIGEQAEAAPGRELVQEVSDKLSNAYNQLLPNMRLTADPQLVSDLTQLRGNMAQGNLPPAQVQQFNNFLRGKVFSRFGPQQAGILDRLTQPPTGTTLPARPGPLFGNGPTPSIDGISYKGMQEELRDASRGYQGDPSYDNRQLGAAIGQVDNILGDALTRSNPQHAGQLQAINSGYAMYARLRDAAGMQGAHDGIFSPGQLANAVRKGDKSAGKGNFARGYALLQDLSDPATRVLGSTVPDSGTAGRSMASAGLVGALAGHAGALFAHPVGTGAAVAAMMPYSPIGQRLMAAYAQNGIPALRGAANAAQQYAPLLGGSVAGGGLLGPRSE